MLKELPCYAHDTGTIITYYESSEKKRKLVEMHQITKVKVQCDEISKCCFPTYEEHRD